MADEPLTNGSSSLLKRLPVDLEELDFFASQHDEPLDSEYVQRGYVDREIGAVHILPWDVLRCADGELEPDDLADWERADLPVAEAILADSSRRYVEIERWASSDSFRIMEEFAEQSRNARLKEALFHALSGRKPFRRFKDVLLNWPEARDAWHIFKDHAHRQMARDWLRRLGIDAEDASPRPLKPLPREW